MLTIKDALLALRRVADREKDYEIVKWCNMALEDTEVASEQMCALALLSTRYIITNNLSLSEALEQTNKATMISTTEAEDVHS